jgi:hypothetical protein
MVIKPDSGKTKGNKMKDKPKETPPFAYSIKDPQFDIIYRVFSYEPIPTNAKVWSYVSQFLGHRKRRMPMNYLNLPRGVKLLVTLDGKVTALDLPTQRQLDDAQRIQNRRNRRIEKIQRSLKKKK